jgi:predicted ATPase/DNA-binding XRE family transcriptional regulator
LTDPSFGEWLKRQRKAAGLTQEELAKRVGCSAIAIRKIEAEQRRPSAQIAELLADIFNVSPNDQKQFLRFARGDWRSAPADGVADTPWRSAPVPRNLPSVVTSLVGREREIAEVRDYLEREDIRLVTLVGPPGIGKTRLSLEAAGVSLSAFPDGVFFVALAPLDDPSLVTIAIVQALGYVEAKNLPAEKQVTDWIGDKHILLVLDNCEHLIEDIAPLVSGLLSACPHLKILATSRESLRIPGEWLYTVPALEVPKTNLPMDVESISNFPALILFAERARAVNSDFALDAGNIHAVASICAQLDGLPLAIELIAARTRLMSPQALLERMNEQFVLSADGMRAVSARQKTLNNAIGWSYNSLPPEEQKIFAHLAVFSGGFTLEMAETFFTETFANKPISDLIIALSYKSLLRRTKEASGEIRFNMLVTIQQFALDRLRGMDEEENTRDQHLKYFVEFSRRAGRELIGPRQVEWRARVIQEIDNLRAALGWALRNNVEAGMYLAGHLGYRFWESFSIREGIHWLTEFLQMPESLAYPKARIKALCAQGFLQFHFQRFDLMRAEAEEMLALSRSIDDKQGECDSLMMLGSAMQFLEGMEQKSELQAKAFVLAESIGDVWRQAEALAGLSWDKRDTQKALACSKQAIALYRQAGDLYGLSRALSLFANYVALNGDIVQAETLLDEYSMLNQYANDKRNMEFILTTKAHIALLLGDYEQARSHLQNNIDILQELGNRMGYLWARARSGYVWLREGDAQIAREIFAECAQEFLKDRNRAGLIFTLEAMAVLLVREEQLERAAQLIGWSEATRSSIGDFVSQLDPSDWARTHELLAAKLGENTFKALCAEGRVMTMEQAVGNALYNF